MGTITNPSSWWEHRRAKGPKYDKILELITEINAVPDEYKTGGTSTGPLGTLGPTNIWDTTTFPPSANDVDGLADLTADSNFDNFTGNKGPQDTESGWALAGTASKTWADIVQFGAFPFRDSASAVQYGGTGISITPRGDGYSTETPRNYVTKGLYRSIRVSTSFEVRFALGFVRTSAGGFGVSKVLHFHLDDGDDQNTTVPKASYAPTTNGSADNYLFIQVSISHGGSDDLKGSFDIQMRKDGGTGDSWVVWDSIAHPADSSWLGIIPVDTTVWIEFRYVIVGNSVLLFYRNEGELNNQWVRQGIAAENSDLSALPLFTNLTTVRWDINHQRYPEECSTDMGIDRINVGLGGLDAESLAFLIGQDQQVNTTANVNFKTVNLDGTATGLDTEGADVDINTGNIIVNNGADITLSAAELAFLDGLDQSLTTTDTPTFDGVTLGTGDIVLGAGTITNAELQQLLTIDATTISATQWGYLGAMDQGVTTTSNVTFNNITASGLITTGFSALQTTTTITTVSTGTILSNQTLRPNTLLAIGVTGSDNTGTFNNVSFKLQARLNGGSIWRDVITATLIAPDTVYYNYDLYPSDFIDYDLSSGDLVVGIDVRYNITGISLAGDADVGVVIYQG